MSLLNKPFASLTCFSIGASSIGIKFCGSSSIGLTVVGFKSSVVNSSVSSSVSSEGLKSFGFSISEKSIYSSLSSITVLTTGVNFLSKYFANFSDINLTYSS